MSSEHLTGASFLLDEDVDKNGTVLVGQGKPSVVFIIADWCGHCRSYKPEIGKILQKEGRVNLYIIEDAKDARPSEKSLIKRMSTIVPGFRGFPTTAFFDSNGKFVETSDGNPRTAEGIKGWITKNL